MTYVHVERTRHGSDQFSGAVADVFTKDTLTVTSERTGEELMVFAPGTWRDAVVTDDNDHPLAWFMSSQAQAEYVDGAA